MALRNRLARLLAKGFEPTLVAKITNISPTQLKYLLADPEFKAQVELAAMGEEDASEQEIASAEKVSLKDALAAAEHKALETIHDRLGGMEDRSLIAAFQVLGNRRDAIEKAEASNRVIDSIANGGVPTVVINLPNIIIPELNYSSQKEVVGIGERSTVPMGRASLTALIEGELANEQLSKA